MKSKPKKVSRLGRALLETAKDMRDAGVLDRAAFEKITVRHLGERVSAGASPIKPKDIRGMRERAHMSQAVFARHLNVTPGYISQLERGAKRPAGAALALLNVIRRKGIDTIL